MRELDRYGIVSDHLLCDVCGELLCRKPEHDSNRLYPRSLDNSLLGIDTEIDPEDLVAPPTRAKSRQTPSHALRADEIAKRIKSSGLLRERSLGALRGISRACGVEKDWLKHLHTLSDPTLDSGLLSLVEGFKLTPTQLWDSLAFEAYREVVDFESATGQAVTAWRQVIAGKEPSEMGKRGWILGARQAINQVWQLVRAQNTVLRSLSRLMTCHVSSMSSWAERDYHPIGSLTLCLFYEAVCLHQNQQTEPYRRPDWSAWDGQRYRDSPWTLEEAAGRSWELALRMDAPKCCALLAKAADWDGPLNLDSPLTYPCHWRYEHDHNSRNGNP